MSGMEQKAGQALNNQGEQCDLDSATTFEVLPAFVVAVTACPLCYTSACTSDRKCHGQHRVTWVVECLVGLVDRDAVVGCHRLSPTCRLAV